MMSKKPKDKPKRFGKSGKFTTLMDRIKKSIEARKIQYLTTGSTKLPKGKQDDLDELNINL